jgi:F-type H+-transporting ATPase subunit b
MDILNQIGGLVLGSVPTILFFLLLVALYGFLVRRPLEKVLAERRARTSGAVEQARGAIAAAEAETTAYEEKLRAARAEIMAARERLLKQWHEDRDKALEAARAASQEKVRAARLEISETSAAARRQIEDSTGSLSEQILRALLSSTPVTSEARPT